MVVALVDQLMREYMFRGRHIGVITPYTAQKKLIKDLLVRKFGREGEEIEVDSVDGFQGREKNVIIFSSVVSSENHGTDLLSDPKRLNVTVTRARYCFFMVGNISHLGMRDPMWANMWHWYSQNGLLHGVSEFVEPYERVLQQLQQRGKKT